MENRQQNKLLDILCSEGEKAERGKLKIFFGMLPGVGKTHAMLRAAQSNVAHGKKVVAGLVDCYNSSETLALLKDFIVIPCIKTEYKGIYFDELDLDAVLAVKPQMVVLANLTHANTPGCSYLSRYQKIQILLENGIDVYTTLNVSQLESCSGLVARVTGETEPDTIPDEIFVMADEVELVDITPEQYIARITNRENYFSSNEQTLRKENINLLRKLAHRITINRLDFRRQDDTRQWKPKLKIMVLIGHDTFSEFLIRRTQSLACLLDTEWIAFYLDTGHPMSEREKRQLADNVKLVGQLGADVITHSGSDPVKESLSIAHRENVTHIFTGRSYSGLSGKRFANRLLNKSGHINIHVYDSEDEPKHKRTWDNFLAKFSSRHAKYVLTLLAAIFIGIVCIPLSHMTGYLYLPFFLLMILLILAINLRIGTIMLSAVVVILTLFFFLVPPQFSFQINATSHLFIFIVFFIIALITGVLINRFKQQEMKVIIREQQTNILFLLNRRLSNAANVEEVVEASINNIKDYFSVETHFIFMDGEYPVEWKHIPPEQNFNETEMKIATWAFKNGKAAGRYTNDFHSSDYTYYPLNGAKLKLGVVAVRWNNFRNGRTAIFWDAFLAQIAQAVENQYMGQLARKTSLLKESETLYKTLFNSISHELRIPLATIMGASDMLLLNQHPEPVKTELYNEIIDASKRLNRLIENLLNMSRIESGRIAARADWCDINDLFHSVVEDLKEELDTLTVETSVPDTMPLVMLDFGLMERTIFNLVYNASIYAPSGTTIGLNAHLDNNRLVLQVTDMGPGFDPKDLPQVFDKFWRSKGSKTGGLGLGLSIVKGFVEAHKGTVSVDNREGGGACFTILIPMEKVKSEIVPDVQ